jgi:hypothetical protein
MLPIKTGVREREDEKAPWKLNMIVSKHLQQSSGIRPPAFLRTAVPPGASGGLQRIVRFIPYSETKWK